MKLIITIEKLTSKNLKISLFEIPPANKLFTKDFWIRGARTKRILDPKAKKKSIR